jgi:hypothetical protein
MKSVSLLDIKMVSKVISFRRNTNLDAGASLQDNLSKRQLASTSSTFNGRREVQPSHFSNLKNVLNVCKAGRAKPCL